MMQLRAVMVLSGLLSVVEIGLLFVAIRYIGLPGGTADLLLAIYAVSCMLSIVVAAIGIRLARSLHEDRLAYFLLIPLIGLFPYLVYLFGASLTFVLQLLLRH